MPSRKIIPFFSSRRYIGQAEYQPTENTMTITVPYISNQPPATTSYKPSWIFVRKRFESLFNETKYEQTQTNKFQASLEGLVSCLDKTYWPTKSDTSISYFITGSWRKDTQTPPESDIDIVYLLPWEMRDRYESRTGNKQSAILQEVKNVLLPSYPRSDIKGDGPTVVADLHLIKFEILPVFLAPGSTIDVRDPNLRIWVCHTSDGGSYEIAAPIAELQLFNEVNKLASGNAVKLTRMLKVWKRYCAVPIKSVVLEGLVMRFLLDYEFSQKDAFWHDWMIRDFLSFMLLQSASISLAGTGEQIPLGNDWASKAKSAHTAAVLACQYEENNLNIHAGTEWQKIFGNFVPLDAS